MQAMHYTALETVAVPRPADRLDLIVNRARGRRVFDLGALDETAYTAKQGSARWLHGRLCAVAADVTGIDNSAKIPSEGLQTAANGRIVRADIFELGSAVSRYGRPDVIVAGELIEHLPDTLGFLRRLRECEELSGAEFIFSTPNACSWHNVLVGMVNRESMHPDHLQVYSYKTLRTLFDRAGIELLSLAPYHVRFDEMLEASVGIKKGVTRIFQSTVHVLEFTTPMLSAGWVGIARL